MEIKLIRQNFLYGAAPYGDHHEDGAAPEEQSFLSHYLLSVYICLNSLDTIFFYVHPFAAC